MKAKISKNSVVNLHFVTDFIDTVKSITTETTYPEKASYNGDSHVASCINGVVTVKRSNINQPSANYKEAINSQLNVDQYSVGTKNPTNNDIKDNVIFDDKTIDNAIESELEINSSRAKDIQREEHFLGVDSNSEDNVDKGKNDDGYVKMLKLDVRSLNDIFDRGRTHGIELIISDEADKVTEVKESTEKDDDKKDKEFIGESYA